MTSTSAMSRDSCDSGRALQQTAAVVEQIPLARDTYRLRIACPELARRIVPGQFFMLRPPGNDPLLARPFALYDVFADSAGHPAGVDLVYHVIGRMTSLMSAWQNGTAVELWGPLGNGFPLPPQGRLVCVGGGIGYTPFLAVAREAAGLRRYGHPPRELVGAPRPITLLYGVRNRAWRADLGDFESVHGCSLSIATDDGTEGHPGLVTELLARELAAGERPAAVFCCGPEPMMAAAAALCRQAGVPCWLSLETPMACGFGACFSCVAQVVTEEPPGWDYRRTCVEGPVFSSDALLLGR